MAKQIRNHNSKTRFLVLIGLMLGISLCFFFDHYFITAYQNIIWSKQETDHLIIHYKKGTYAALNIKLACEEYEKSYSKMRSQIPVGKESEAKKIHILLHEQSRRRVSGWAKPERNEAHYMYTRNRKLTTSHEMMHVILKRYNPKAPLRFEEGVCRYFEGQKITVDDESAHCPFYRLAKLQPQTEWQVKKVFLPTYKTSGQACIAAAFVSYLMEQLGPQGFWDFYGYITEGNYILVLEEKLDIEIKQINKDFEMYIQSLEDPPSLFPRVQTR